VSAVSKNMHPRQRRRLVGVWNGKGVCPRGCIHAVCQSAAASTECVGLLGLNSGVSNTANNRISLAYFVSMLYICDNSKREGHGATGAGAS
jgi:hypothetical protein